MGDELIKETIFRIVDKDQNNVIDFSEFLALTALLSRGTDDEKNRGKSNIYSINVLPFLLSLSISSIYYFSCLCDI